LSRGKRRKRGSKRETEEIVGNNQEVANVALSHTFQSIKKGVFETPEAQKPSKKVGRVYGVPKQRPDGEKGAAVQRSKECVPQQRHLFRGGKVPGVPHQAGGGKKQGKPEKAKDRKENRTPR